MSSSLNWKPVTAPSGHLSTGTKFLLRELQDGNVDRVLTEDDIDWLTVLKLGRDREIKHDIDELLAAIEKHGAIHIWESWG